MNDRSDPARLTRAGSGVLAGVLALAGCTPPATVPGPDGSPSPVPSGDIGIHGCTPARTLIPADSVDACGLRITEAITARLVRIDPGTSSVVMDLARSIDTEDHTTFTVHLDPARTFSDGTRVRARNFVSAWNWAARGANRMAGESMFAPIAGADALRCHAEDCDPDAGPTEMAGLKVIDDGTFTITTTGPVTDLVAQLAHPVFAPLPDSFFAEGRSKEAYAKQPVGAGPFRLASASGSPAVLERVEAYAGPAPARVKKVTVWYYDQPARGATAQRAYDDVVAGRLDFTAVVPTDMLLDDQWKSDLKDRFALADTRTQTTLAFVAADRQLADNPLLRRAIGRAIDRPTLTRRIFQETRTPATSWVSPAVWGYPTDACGEACAYDLDAARDDYRRAGGYAGAFEVTVNGDGGNKEWADSLCNQLKSNLELDCQVNVLDNQRAVLEQLAAKRLTGVVRQGIGVHATTPAPYLAPYRSDDPANVSGHDDTRYDDLLVQASRAATPEDARTIYRQAEGRLAADPPSLPLWTGATPIGWSARITDVRLTPYGTLDLSSVRLR